MKIKELLKSIYVNDLNDQLPVIDETKTEEFIDYSNNNKLTKDFLEECKKSFDQFKKDF